MADAEDVLQEAFVRYWKNQKHLPGDPAALLITSIRRAALDLARKETRRVNREQAAQVLEGDPVTWFKPPEDEQEQHLQMALAVLPQEQRQVVSLKIWGGLTFEQIGEQLECSPNTAASRYRYALGRLKEAMRKRHAK